MGKWRDFWLGPPREEPSAPAAEARAVSDVPWDRGGSLGGSSAVSQDRALGLAPVFAAARVLAGTVSTLPLKAYRRVGDDRVPMTSLPQLFQQRSDEGSLVPWLHQCVSSMALRGNAYGLITSRDGFGFPTRVEWMAPSDISVDDNRSVVRPTWYWQGREVPREDLLHIPWFTVPGRVLGLSPISAFAATINTGLYAQAYGNDWFEAGGFPPGTMRNTVLPALEPAVAEEVSNRVTGAIRRRRPLVTGSDWEYSPVTVPPNEAQFVQTMQLSATQIANIYGLPPEDVGGSRGTSLTYATVELNQLERTLAVRPWLVAIEHAFAAQLPERQYVKFSADAIVRTDLKSRWEAYKTARELGVYSVDDIRRLEDLPPLPDGKGQDYTPAPAKPAAPAPAPAAAPAPAVASLTQRRERQA